MGNDRRKTQTNYRKGISFENVPNSFNQHKKESKNKLKDGYVVCKGKVLEAYPNAMFLVEIDDVGNRVNATLAGKLRLNYIRILVGDRVELELSVYDTSKGRISRRL